MVGADGSEVTIPADLRIVSMGGTVTETLYALGLGEAVVGADISSTYPPEVAEKATLGYFRQASAEGVVSLSPTLVVSTGELGPATVVEQIRAAGVGVLIVEDANTWAQAERRIRFLGQALGQHEAAEEILAGIEREREAATPLRPHLPVRTMFVYARGVGAVYVSGTNTVADLMIRESGGINVVSSFEGFQQLTPEAVVEAAPDMIVMQESGLESVGGVDGLFALPGIAQTPAAKTRSVVTMDGALLVGIGPRSGRGVQILTAKLAKASAAR